GKTFLKFWGPKIKLENAFAGIAPKRFANIFHGALRQPELDRGVGAEPLAVGAFFAFRDRVGKTASQIPAVAQHSRSQPRRAVDGTFGIRRRPFIEVGSGLVCGKMERAPAINVQAVGSLLRASPGERKKNVEQLH